MAFEVWVDDAFTEGPFEDPKEAAKVALTKWKQHNPYGREVDIKNSFDALDEDIWNYCMEEYQPSVL